MREVVMACRTLGLATALILVASCLAQDRGGGDPGVAWPLIGSVLKEAQVSGSLEYWGHCGSGMWRPDFPKIRPSVRRVCRLRCCKSVRQIIRKCG